MRESIHERRERRLDEELRRSNENLRRSLNRLNQNVEERLESNREINESVDERINQRRIEMMREEERDQINQRLERLDNEREDILANLNELLSDEFDARRVFSNFIEGILGFCDICLRESARNYHQCQRCHKTWCLNCHSRIDNCPYCRN